MYEIERRFLISSYPANEVKGLPVVNILQTYLAGTGDWTIRSRYAVSDEADAVGQATLTMKQRVSHGKSIEIEDQVQKQVYDQMAFLAGSEIVKDRIKIPHGKHTIEFDCFRNPELNDLMIAEVELSSIDEEFEIPAWFGREVTGESKYSNHNLFKHLQRLNQHEK